MCRNVLVSLNFGSVTIIAYTLQMHCASQSFLDQILKCCESLIMLYNHEHTFSTSLASLYDTQLKGGFKTYLLVIIFLLLFLTSDLSCVSYKKEYP